MPFAEVDQQLSVIRRGTAHIEKLEELQKKLERSRAKNEPLRIKLGIDPTGFDVHLGHTVVLRKLRQFQDLGHTVVLIIGTATARVGDPSGRDESRKSLTMEQIEKNAATYLTQIDLQQSTQHILFARNAAGLQIPEGATVEWHDTLCRRAIDEERRYTDDVAAHWGDSQAAQALGIRTYLSSPVRTSSGSRRV